MVGNEAEDGVSSPSGLIVTMSTALGGIGRKKGIGGGCRKGDLKINQFKNGRNDTQPSPLPPSPMKRQKLFERLKQNATVTTE